MKLDSSRSLTDLTLAETSRLLAQREVSPVELVEASLSRIEEFNPRLHAFNTVAADTARAAAREIEGRIRARQYRGGIDGIPVAVKDNIETAGIRTTSNSRVLIDHVPDDDAHLVKRLARAGGIMIGKTATWEFAQGRPEWDAPWLPAANPWSLAHQPGGSSSGSGAAVAGRMVCAAIGTDTGGSIRFPAACCGVVGLKPTYGRVSRRGVHPNTFSLDHCGPLARTVEDCAILLGALAGHDALDPGSIDEPVADYRSVLTGDIRGVRVGLVRHWYAGTATNEVERAVDTAAALLADLGAAVREVKMDPLQDYVDCKSLLAVAELHAVHHADLEERPQDFGRSIRTMMRAGALLRADDYVQALRWRADLVRRMFGHFDRVDVLVTAGWMQEADPYEPGAVTNRSNRPPITMPFSIGGNPALNIPCGFTSQGLPLSLQVAGKPFDEAGVLRLAHAYEQASGWLRRVPPLLRAQGT